MVQNLTRAAMRIGTSKYRYYSPSLFLKSALLVIMGIFKIRLIGVAMPQTRFIRVATWYFYGHDLGQMPTHEGRHEKSVLS